MQVLCRKIFFIEYQNYDERFKTTWLTNIVSCDVEQSNEIQAFKNLRDVVISITLIII